MRNKVSNAKQSLKYETKPQMRNKVSNAIKKTLQYSITENEDYFSLLDQYLPSISFAK